MIVTLLVLVLVGTTCYVAAGIDAEIRDTDTDTAWRNRWH